MLIRSHAAFAAIAATIPNVAWINPVGLTCDSSGQWLPGMYASGTVRLHLSQRAARLHGEVIKSILDAKYASRENAIQNYDTVSAWYTVSSGEPTGVDTAAVGSSTIGTRATANGMLSIPFTTTADADGAHVLFTGLKTWLTGGVTGDKFRLIFDHELGRRWHAPPVLASAMDIRLAVSGRGHVTSSIHTMSAPAVTGARRSWSSWTAMSPRSRQAALHGSSSSQCAALAASPQGPPDAGTPA
ncbi:MAG: hypothetical protein IPP74_13330 [Alphaproteobacteria bacterium]|nr:hypothetical protein [Alphaproteobacteria bacterium]